MASIVSTGARQRQGDARPFDPARLSPRSQEAFAALFMLPDGEYVQGELARALGAHPGITAKWAEGLVRWVADSDGFEHRYEVIEGKRRWVLRVRRRRLEEMWPSFDWRSFAPVWLDVDAVSIDEVSG